METSSKAVLWLVGLAMVVGAVVLAFNPEYRDTLRAWRQGMPAEAAIWRSNDRYYDAVDLESRNDEEADAR